jgi:hypothetical protein
MFWSAAARRRLDKSIDVTTVCIEAGLKDVA